MTNENLIPDEVREECGCGELEPCCESGDGCCDQKGEEAEVVVAENTAPATPEVVFTEDEITKVLCFPHVTMPVTDPDDKVVMVGLLPKDQDFDLIAFVKAEMLEEPEDIDGLKFVFRMGPLRWVRIPEGFFENPNKYLMDQPSRDAYVREGLKNAKAQLEQQYDAIASRLQPINIGLQQEIVEVNPEKRQVGVDETVDLSMGLSILTAMREAYGPEIIEFSPDFENLELVNNWVQAGIITLVFDDQSQWSFFPPNAIPLDKFTMDIDVTKWALEVVTSPVEPIWAMNVEDYFPNAVEVLDEIVSTEEVEGDQCVENTQIGVDLLAAMKASATMDGKLLIPNIDSAELINAGIFNDGSICLAVTGDLRVTFFPPNYERNGETAEWMVEVYQIGEECRQVGVCSAEKAFPDVYEVFFAQLAGNTASGTYPVFVRVDPEMLQDVLTDNNTAPTGGETAELTVEVYQMGEKPHLTGAGSADDADFALKA